MNFFTQGIGNVAGTYADYLDSLIGNIDDRLLTYVVSATPEIQKREVNLTFSVQPNPGQTNRFNVRRRLGEKPRRT